MCVCPLTLCFSRCVFSSLSLQSGIYSDGTCSLLWDSADSVPEFPLVDFPPASSRLPGLAPGGSLCFTVPFSLVPEVLCLCSSLHMKPKLPSKFSFLSQYSFPPSHSSGYFSRFGLQWRCWNFIRNKCEFQIRVKMENMSINI